MRCIVCGNNIKDNVAECPICGSAQLGTPVYNTQQFTDLQHQINNMHINNTFVPPVLNQQRYDVKKGKSKDVTSMVCGIIGLWYTFSVITVIFNGLDTFINENLNTYLSNPEYADMLKEPLTLGLCITWPLFLAGIIGLIFGIMGRKIEQNKMNAFGIISSVCALATGIGATYYIYTFLS